jgi:hypothetical protein
MLNACNYTSILLFLGPSDVLQGFTNPNLLHSQFFISCIGRDEFIQTFQQHANIVHDMDIYLPNTAVDLIGRYKEQYPQKRFHLYCETEYLVNNYRGTMRNICEQVFNVNQIERKLYKTANRHLLRYIDDLENRADEGDVDAGDLLIPIGELFEQTAAIIIEDIRQRDPPPQPPME